MYILVAGGGGQKAYQVYYTNPHCEELGSHPGSKDFFAVLSGLRGCRSVFPHAACDPNSGTYVASAGPSVVVVVVRGCSGGGDDWKIKTCYRNRKKKQPRPKPTAATAAPAAEYQQKINRTQSIALARLFACSLARRNERSHWVMSKPAPQLQH